MQPVQTASRLPLQYHLNFYLEYLAKWPEYCQMAEGPAKQNMGYSEHRCCTRTLLKLACTCMPSLT